MMHRVFALALVLFLLGTRSTALASPLLELTGGFGGRGGLQARHTGPSAASSYFNPALLTRARAGLTAGILVVNTNIGVRVDPRYPVNAVPDGSADAYHADGSAIASKPLETARLQNGAPATGSTPGLKARPRQGQGSGNQTLGYGSVGLVMKLLGDRLAVGIYGLVPLKDYVTMHSFYVDEREQYSSNSLHPEMYGDRLTSISFAFAAGVRLTDTLSLGLGATLGLVAHAGAPVYVANAGELDKLDINVNVKAKIALTPHLGVAWDPARRWHLTGTVHAPQRLDVDAGFTFILGGSEQSSGLALTYFYQPWQASGGLGYDFVARKGQVWSVSGLLLYQRWSKYIDRQSVRPAGAYEFMDTLSGSVGLRGESGPFSFALDGQYQPSPVPAQTGRTNYVDNNRLGALFAAAYAFRVSGYDFKVGLQMQLYRLLERAVRKIPPPVFSDGVNRTPQLVWDEVPDDALRSGRPLEGRQGLQTNNPGWPGYSSRGWVSSGGLYLSLCI